MATSGVKVLVIGKRVPLPPQYEAVYMDRLHNLFGTLAQFQPDVIVTSEFIPGVLRVSAFELRKKWIHVDPKSSPEAVIRAIEDCYAFNLWGVSDKQKFNPLISVYTGTFNTGDYLRETFQSLKEQTYKNWEWVVVDDHSTDGTWERLEEMAREDFRVRPFRSGKPLRKIGAVKDLATRLSKGVYLVELDHDDMLTDFALDEIKQAFESDPEIGMVYSNCSNFFEDGTFHRFPYEHFKDKYRETEYRGKKWLECINHDIYGRFGNGYHEQNGFWLTVGPNHVRAYRASKLFELGGYNPSLPVADDWDLYARFFLRSKCHHINKMLYLYRFLDAYQNTTFTRNQSIQDHLAHGQNHYAEEFKAFNERRLAGTEKKPAPVHEEELTTSDISYVVPEGAQSELTVRCLKSIREFSPGSEIILVANGDEPLPEAVTLADKVVRLEMNLRFAAACNRGAMEATRKVVCIMNNDAEFVDFTPAMLVNGIDELHPIVAPFSNRAKPPQGDIEQANVPKESLHPDMVVGVCMMMPTDLYRALGGFDPRLYTWEDDDICRRAQDLGFGCSVVGGTFVMHERHATFKARGEDVQAVMRENREIFGKKHPRIRVVAISKNEERSLPGYFHQFSGVTRDWCLLDTGSTDDTLSIAKAMGIKVESCPFEDFAQARNEALDRFGKDADWIIMLDPDERLDAHTIQNIKETVFRTKFDIFLAPLRAVYPNTSRNQAFVPKPFLFRSKPDIRWVFKVHEKLVGSHRQALVKNAMIEHHIALHDDGRRELASGLYDRLSKEEPYFTDPDYKKAMIGEWPILDYDRMDDERIRKTVVGPLVSVVMPTYRRKGLLQKAVASALNQDYENLEVVVVGDDCPELGTVSFAPERVRIFNLPKNHGSGGAVPRNYGIMLAAGELIAYLDDDNSWLPDHVSSIYEMMRRSDASYGFSSMQVAGKDLLFTEPKFQGIDTSCVVHQKGLVLKYRWWKDRIEGSYAHDWEFFSRFVKGVEKWVCTKSPTLLYNEESSGQFGFLKRLAEERQNEKNHLLLESKA